MLTDTQAEQPAPDRPTLYPGQVVDVFIEGDRQSQTARGQTAP
jgi:hypothetical protein